MYKLSTSLNLFRYNSSVIIAPVSVMWYVLDSDELSMEYGRGFTQEELKLLQGFATNHEENFPKFKNYHQCDIEENFSICSPYDQEELPFPENLILRKEPSLSKDGKIYRCMDILLVSTNNEDNHTYDLEFDVIGRIEH